MKSVKNRWWLYDYDDNSLIGVYNTKKEYDKKVRECKLSGIACFGMDTEMLIYNLAIDRFER